MFWVNFKFRDCAKSLSWNVLGVKLDQNSLTVRLNAMEGIWNTLGRPFLFRTNMSNAGNWLLTRMHMEILWRLYGRLANF